jgi:hypothetical protein
MTWLTILVEEESTQAFLAEFLPRLDIARASFKVLNLGSKPKLLGKLGTRLSALREDIGAGAARHVLVLVDRDGDDCVELKRFMETASRGSGLATKSSPRQDGSFDVVNRVLVSELECWFLGDPEALRRAYPSLPPATRGKGHFASPERRNWEFAEAYLQKHGIYRGGLKKVEFAQRLGRELGLKPHDNACRSFREFLAALDAMRS